MTTRPPHTIVVGAGIGGLTTTALLIIAGHRVTVLEAHVCPGGSAGTFYHQKYRFDVGATLVGGFGPDGPHTRLGEALGLEWPTSPVDPAWVVHLPDGRSVTQWADRQAWEVERLRAFPGKESFWKLQERLADIAWDISARNFPWPPRTVNDLVALAQSLRPRTLSAVPYLLKSVSDLGIGKNPLFRAFLDSQLLISAQTSAAEAGALYGSAALDLPRRGVNHVRGGVGSLATTLVDWIRAHGGEVIFRQRVRQIRLREGRATGVETEKGLSIEADFMVANQTPWGLQGLLGEESPPALDKELARRRPTWGAFTLYLGLDQSALPNDLADHHQVIVDADQPLGEGNSVFVSLSEGGDAERAPAGMRAATLSTHTAVAPWWQLRHGPSEQAYLDQREVYAERLISATESAIPGIRAAIRLKLPGTPVTFQNYTGRPMGMVGGFAQQSIFSARGPQTGIPNLWLVGDSVFPGQSTAGVTLGAMRVSVEVAAAGRRLTRLTPAAKLPARRIPAHE